MTPLQELIQEMEELKKTKLYPESFKAIDECIHLAWAKLSKEKEEIVEAYDNVCSDEHGNILTGEQYYLEAFKS